MSRAVRHFLMKTEPDVFSIDDLVRVGKAPWEGVRNYQARNLMREMAIGDLVLFYHSSTEPPGVVGLARVASEAYPDASQFDPKSEYHEPRASAERPFWYLVDVELAEKLPRCVTLAELKADDALDGMLVRRKGMRLSVQPVEPAHYARVVELARSPAPG